MGTRPMQKEISVKKAQKKLINASRLVFVDEVIFAFLRKRPPKRSLYCQRLYESASLLSRTFAVNFSSTAICYMFYLLCNTRFSLPECYGNGPIRILSLKTCIVALSELLTEKLPRLVFVPRATR